MHIKVGDEVIVIAGDDRGERAKVLSVDHDKGKVVVEGVNRVYKHVRRSQRNPQGGRLSKEMPLPASNLMLVCPSCNAPSRTGIRIEPDGSKVRWCKSCGQEDSKDKISPAKQSRATS